MLPRPTLSRVVTFAAPMDRNKNQKTYCDVATDKVADRADGQDLSCHHLQPL